MSSDGYEIVYLEQQLAIVASLKIRKGTKALPLKSCIQEIEFFSTARPLHKLDLSGDPANFFIERGLHVFSFECQGDWVQYAVDPTLTKTEKELETISEEWNEKFRTEEDVEYFCMNPACPEYLVPNCYDCECDHY